MKKTIEVKDADGNVVAAAEVDDDAHLGRMMARLDRTRTHRSQLAITLRDHIVASRSGGNITCKCGEVLPTANQWAVHVATTLIPAPI
jgi:hypothetical protein